MRAVLTLVVLCVASPTTATHAQDEMAASFQTVPMADRPWVYWWWLNGNIDRATITDDLEAMKRLGFGGLLLFDARGYHDDGGHLHIPEPANAFMDAEWQELLGFSIREAGADDEREPQQPRRGASGSVAGGCRCAQAAGGPSVAPGGGAGR
jgi:hypothetical protein